MPPRPYQDNPFEPSSSRDDVDDYYGDIPVSCLFPFNFRIVRSQVAPIQSSSDFDLTRSRFAADEKSFDSLLTACLLVYTPLRIPLEVLSVFHSLRLHHSPTPKIKVVICLHSQLIV